MSSCLFLLEKNRVFVSGDTATSFRIDNELYRVDERAIKLYQFDNRMIVFISGDMGLVYSIVDKFEHMEHTIENLRKTIIQGYNESKSSGILLHKKSDSYINLACVVGVIENNEAVVYHIAEDENFEPTKIIGVDNNVGIYAIGIRAEECYESAKNYVMSGYNVQEIYRRTYRDIAFEGIGGKLNVLYLDKQGVHVLLNEFINEKKYIKKLNQNQEYTDKNGLRYKLDNTFKRYSVILVNNKK